MAETPEEKDAQQPLSDLFSAAELLALLPSASDLQPPLSPDIAPLVPGERDPAADFRAEDPMTLERLLKALAPLRGLRFLAAARGWPRLNRLPVSRTVLYILPDTVAAPYATWEPALASGVFAVRGAAVSVAALAFGRLVYHLIFLVQRVPAWGRPPTEDTSPFAGLARWIELSGWAGSDGADAEAAYNGGGRTALRDLLAHHDHDLSCPCRRSSCAGRLPRMSSTIQVGRQVVLMLILSLVHWLLPWWTPTVFLADSIWVVPWKAVIFGYLPVIYFVLHVSVSLEGISSDAALLDLDGRVEARAISLTLSEAIKSILVEEQEGRETALDPPELSGSPSSRQSFIALHQMLAPKWRARAKMCQEYNYARAVAFAFDLVVLLVLMLGAGCATAWAIGSIASHAIEIIYALSTFAMGNTSVARNTSLYGRAASGVRLAFAERRRAVPPDAAAQLAALEVFARAADDNYARLFGVPVTFGLVRGLSVTLVTISVGLVGILRGAGVRATMQSWCPIE